MGRYSEPARRSTALSYSDEQTARRLAALLADLERRIRHLERAPQLINSSLDTATLPIYDDTGTLRVVIGLQSDGTYTVLDLNAPAPVAPAPPTLALVSDPGVLGHELGLVNVRADGLTVDGSPWPLDLDHVDVHVWTASSGSVTARPGAVSLVVPASRAPHPTSVVVGAAPQWADASDATYALIHCQNEGGWSGSETARAPMPTLAEMGVAPGDITDAVVHVRMSTTTPADVRPTIDISDVAESVVPPVFADLDSPRPAFVSGVPVDWTYALTQDTTIENVVAAMTGPSWLNIQTIHHLGDNLTIHEAWLELTVQSQSAAIKVGQFGADDLGSMVVALAAGTWHCVLVAVNTSGTPSLPSVEATVTVPAGT